MNRHCEHEPWHMRKSEAICKFNKRLHLIGRLLRHPSRNPTRFPRNDVKNNGGHHEKEKSFTQSFNHKITITIY